MPRSSPPGLCQVRSGGSCGNAARLKRRRKHRRVSAYRATAWRVRRTRPFVVIDISIFGRSQPTDRWRLSTMPSDAAPADLVTNAAAVGGRSMPVTLVAAIQRKCPELEGCEAVLRPEEPLSTHTALWRCRSRIGASSDGVAGAGVRVEGWAVCRQGGRGGGTVRVAGRVTVGSTPSCRSRRRRLRTELERAILASMRESLSSGEIGMGHTY